MTVRGIFVAGTGTGVGKTVAAALILRLLRARGLNAAPMKPVQTGCRRDARGGMVAPDLEFALAAAGMNPDGHERSLMAPFRYEPACSPHLAGKLAGKCPDLETISENAAGLSGRYDALVAEGAGGTLVPLDERRTMRDLIERLGFPAVVVAGTGLGTINHSLLTLESLRARGIPVLGMIYNDSAPCGSEEERAIRDDNPRAIERISGAATLGTLGAIEGMDRGSISEAAWKKAGAQIPGISKILESLRP